MGIVFLFLIIFGKLIDVHISSDQEIREFERIEQTREMERNNEIRQDVRSSEERKYEALETMIRNGDGI